MKKHIYLIIIVLIIIVIGGVCYFSIYKGNKEVDTVTKKTEENIIETVSAKNEQNANQEIENNTTTSENVIENNIVNEEKVDETKKIDNVKVANKPKQNTNNEQTTAKTPIKQDANKTVTQENTKQEQSVQEQPKNKIQEETKPEEIKQEPTVEEPKPVQLDFSKYDRYYPALNGGYTCFKKNQQEMSKLRGLLENAIQEFGYTNVKLVEDSSVISNRYFTANKTNAQNVVYNTEGFLIHYYAETEYTLSSSGNESMLQIRSYAEIRGQ